MPDNIKIIEESVNNNESIDDLAKKLEVEG